MESNSDIVEVKNGPWMLLVNEPATDTLVAAQQEGVEVSDGELLDPATSRRVTYGRIGEDGQFEPIRQIVVFRLNEESGVSADMFAFVSRPGQDVHHPEVWFIDLILTEEGKTKLSRMTEAIVGDTVAFGFGDEVFTYAVVNEPIRSGLLRIGMSDAETIAAIFALITGKATE